MSQPVLCDLFCKAGGAAKGYARAGFRVVGVDVEPQPRYPFEFHQADAMTFPLDGFDAFHASPPCQDHIRARGNGKLHGTGWLLAATRDRLETTGKPWAIENVPGAPMRPDYRLCGCQFGLRRLKRERWFETSWRGLHIKPPCYHPEPTISVTGSGTPTGTWLVYGSLKLADFRAVMGIDWMNRKELSQAIPPAYTEFIGRAMLAHLSAGACRMTDHPSHVIEVHRAAECLRCGSTNAELAKPCPNPSPAISAVSNSAETPLSDSPTRSEKLEHG